MASVQVTFGHLFAAWKFIWATPRRRLLVILPILLNLLIWITVIPLAFYFAQWATSIPLPDAGWATVLSLLVGAFAVVATGILGVFLFVALTTIIGAPFYSVLAEDAVKESGMVVKEVPWWKEMFFALRYTFKLGILFVVLQLFLVVFNIIPGIGTVLHLVGGFTVGILLLAMEFFGEAFSKQGILFRGRMAFLARHHLSVIAFAVPVFFLLLIPVLNLVIPPLAIVAATRIYGDTRKSAVL